MPSAIDQRDWIKAQYQACKRQGAIAAELGISRGHISRIIHDKASYDPARREYQRNWQRRRRVELEMRGLCVRCGYDVDEDYKVSRRRRGYSLRGGVRKLTPGALEEYARHKGYSVGYMQPQYRDESIDREARAFRHSGGRRNDATSVPTSEPSAAPVKVIAESKDQGMLF